MSGRAPSLLACAAFALASAGVSSPAWSQCPAEGDCRAVHETPGCVMPECCELVCKANPLCCEIGWDAKCVEFAMLLCEGINCPAQGACDEPHGTPGCSDYECCDLLSKLDSWCTNASWDDLCAREQNLLCGIGTCAIELGGAIGEDEPCYRRLNEGCAIGVDQPRLEISCGATMHGKIAGGGPRDTDWFVLDGAERRRFRIEIVSEFPAEVQLLTGGCDEANETRWLIGLPPCSGPQRVTFLAAPGVASLILASGTEFRALRQSMACDEINPKNPPIPGDPEPVRMFNLRWRLTLDCLKLGDIDGDGVVNAVDLSLLLNAWGTLEPGYDLDPRLPDADLDGDGRVSASDLAILLSDW